jgi:4-carboxymuconolactone decarboxylase
MGESNNMATTRQKALDVAGKMLPPDLMQLLSPDNRAPFGAELSDLGLAMIFEPLWTREGIDLRTRSLITVAMLITLRAHSELAIHAPAAIRNGATVAELEEIIYQSAGYAGFPAAASARDVVREALKKAGMLS